MPAASRVSPSFSSTCAESSGGGIRQVTHAPAIGAFVRASRTTPRTPRIDGGGSTSRPAGSRGVGGGFFSAAASTCGALARSIASAIAAGLLPLVSGARSTRGARTCVASCHARARARAGSSPSRASHTIAAAAPTSARTTRAGALR